MNGYEHDIPSYYEGSSHCTNFFIASQKGCIECLIKFLDRGVNINTQDINGNTALHCLLSVLKNYIKLQKTKDRIDVSIYNKILSQYIKCIKLLLDNGLDPQLKNKKGETCFNILNLFEFL